ncbi:MAG: RNA-dependent DNA polymerase [Desulfobacteraceae bacterium]|nr:RNA-dependent DNA polymerase [Desulfobacteraceae bacterium]
MKRQGHLFENVCSFQALYEASLRAARGKKTKKSAAGFLYNLEGEIIAMEEEIRSGRWQPGPYRVFTVHDPKERRICASDFRDRVVHHAVCEVLEPIFDRHYITGVYACRKGKGNHRAMSRAQAFTRKYDYFLKLDVHKFFDSIDHEILKGQLRRKIKDERFLHLTDRIIDHSVPWTEPGKGLPIGNLTSQHFANYYLSGLDHFIKEHLRIPGYVRYMDDMVLFADEKDTLWQAGAEIKAYLNHRLGLRIKEGSLILAPVLQGLSFLGFRIFPGVIRISRKGWRRFRRKTMGNMRRYEAGEMTEDALVRSTASLAGYLKYGDTRNLRASFLERPGAFEATGV